MHKRGLAQRWNTRGLFLQEQRFTLRHRRYGLLVQRLRGHVDGLRQALGAQKSPTTAIDPRTRLRVKRHLEGDAARNGPVHETLVDLHALLGVAALDKALLYAGHDEASGQSLFEQLVHIVPEVLSEVQESNRSHSKDFKLSDDGVRATVHLETKERLKALISEEGGTTKFEAVGAALEATNRLVVGRDTTPLYVLEGAGVGQKLHQAVPLYKDWVVEVKENIAKGALQLLNEAHAEVSQEQVDGVPQVRRGVDGALQLMARVLTKAQSTADGNAEEVARSVSDLLDNPQAIRALHEASADLLKLYTPTPQVDQGRAAWMLSDFLTATGRAGAAQSAGVHAVAGAINKAGSFKASRAVGSFLDRALDVLGLRQVFNERIRRESAEANESFNTLCGVDGGHIGGLALLLHGASEFLRKGLVAIDKFKIGNVEYPAECDALLREAEAQHDEAVGRVAFQAGVQFQDIEGHKAVEHALREIGNRQAFEASMLQIEGVFWEQSLYLDVDGRLAYEQAMGNPRDGR